MAEPVLKKIGNLFKRLTGKKKKPIITPIDPSPRTPGPTGSQRQEPSRRAHSRRSGHGSADAPRPTRERRQQADDRGQRRKPKRSEGETQQAARRPRAQAPPKEHLDAKPLQKEVPWDPVAFTVPPEEGKVRFHDLNLPQEIMRAVYDLGFQYCTPIQAAILEHTLAGKDATGRAQTGTGKTAAFLITILTHFLRNPLPGTRKNGTPRALILAPTRELVLQIEKDADLLAKHTKASVVAVFGGMEYRKQEQLLGDGVVDIVAATPGRLLDFKRNRKIDLSKVEILVIDEADRMLDMGFIPDVRRIIESTPMKGMRQTMFFSATLTPDVNRLAAAWTRDPVQIDVTPPRDITLSTIDQVVYIITDDEKLTLLYNMITKLELQRVMVFANRRDETQRLKDLLTSLGIRCGLLSGDVSQEQRVKTLEAFRNGRFRILVATDVAARGLHIEGVTHVVNYSLPLDPEDYVHRIGRTGRAGASGTSVSFATETEAYEIPEIEKYIGRDLAAIHPDPELLTPLPPFAEGPEGPQKRAPRGRRPGGQRRRPQRGEGSRRRGGGGAAGPKA